MNKKYRVLIALGLALTTAGVTGCSNVAQVTPVSVTASTYNENAQSLFNTATSYTMAEKLLTVRTHYDVKNQDGVLVGTIEGNFSNTLGINLNLYDVNSNLLLSGKEVNVFTSFKHKMELSDQNGNIEGYFQETTDDLFSLGRNMHFMDKDDTEVGTSDQPFIAVLEAGHYYDNDNELAYTIDTDIALTMDSTITVHSDKNISREKAVLMRAFISEIGNRSRSANSHGSSPSRGR